MEIDNYISSYNKNHFIESVNIKDAHGIKNDNYLWDSFTTWLNDSDCTVEQYPEPLIQKKDELKKFNNQLINFVIQIIYLYRQVGFFQQDNNVGKIGILIGHDKVLEALSNLKFSVDIIEHYILNGEHAQAILFRKYCIKKLNEIIFNIETILSIRLQDSPLKQHLENVVNVLENSIDLKELEIIRELNKILTEKTQQPEAKMKQESVKIKASVLALFCSLVNEIDINKMEKTESVKNYCNRICEKYGFPYTDRVRQNFRGNETKKNRNELTEKVLPFLDAKTKSKIQKYLDTKYPPIQDLYA